MMIRLDNVSYHYNENSGIDDISMTLPEGKITTIVGPNGAGKSTLLKVLTGEVSPTSGKLLIDDKDSKNMSAKEIAQKVAILHQENKLYDEMTVEQLISLGKLPSIKLFDEPKLAIDDDLIDLLKLDELRKKNVSELSGGQKQRVWLALALNQATPYLFLDEPTTYLDLHYQQELLRILKWLVKNKNLTICMVLHDLNQALRISDYCYLLDHGKIIKHGAAAEVLSEKTVQDTFGIDCQLIQTEHGPYLIEY